MQKYSYIRVNGQCRKYASATKIYLRTVGNNFKDTVKHIEKTIENHMLTNKLHRNILVKHVFFNNLNFYTMKKQTIKSIASILFLAVLLCDIKGQSIQVDCSGRVGINSAPVSGYALYVNGYLLSSNMGTSNIHLYSGITCPSTSGLTIRGTGSYGGYEDKIRVGINTPYLSNASLKVSSQYPGSTVSNAWALYVDGPQFSTSGSYFQTSDSREEKH